MKKWYTFGAISLVLGLSFLLFITFFLYSSSHIPAKDNAPITMNSTNATSIVIYDRGKTINISPDKPEFQQLLVHSENQLKTADSIFKLAVTEHLIRSIYNNEISVEIRYPKPKTFIIPINNLEIKPKRLLISLTGEFAGKITTIFYGDDRFYRPGPYVNSKGTKEFEYLVESLGTKID